MGPIGKNLLTQSEDYWLRGLCFYDAGSRSFYTKERVATPDDLKGMKIRVMNSNTAIKMVNNMGGAATPISFGELYTALQQGVVDGAENNPPSFFMSKHYEVCKFYTLDEHTSVPDVLVVGTTAWKGLSAQQKEWLQEAADESAVFQRKIWAEAEAEALAAVEKSGVEIIRPEKEPFAGKVQEMYDAFKDEPQVYKLINEIRNVN